MAASFPASGENKELAAMGRSYRGRPGHLGAAAA